MNFREIDRRLCIILDPVQAKQLCRAFVADKPELNPNSMLCMGYIDTEAGITYEVFAVTYYEDGDYAVLADIDCFLQAPNGKSCREKMEKIASPFWRKLQRSNTADVRQDIYAFAENNRFSCGS